MAEWISSRTRIDRAFGRGARRRAAARLCGLLAWGTALAASSLPSTPALAASSPASEELAQQVVVEQLTADFAARLARDRNLANAEQQARFDELEAKDRKLRAAEAKASITAEKLAKIGRQRAKLAKQRKALVDELVARDRQLAAQVTAFREAVTGIAASPNPKKRAALQRYANGERREALAELDEIVEAENTAIAIAANMQRAANLRPNAWLALNNKDHGEELLGSVVKRFEKITGLDPWASLDWIELATLYQEQGRLGKAAKAGKSALASQTGDHERMVSLWLLGEIEMNAGKLRSASTRLEESLAIAKKRVKADPHSALAQRDLSISLNKLGWVEVQAGNLAAARDLFQRDLEIADKLAKADPHSALAQRDLSISLEKLGSVEVQAGNLAAARDLFQRSLKLRQKLAKADPHSAQAQRDLSISLEKLGSVEVQAGNLAAARDLFQRDLEIAEKLAKADPHSAQAQRDLSVSLNQLGSVEVQAGNLAAARNLFQRSLKLRQKLAKADPHNSQASFDVVLSHLHIVTLAAKEGNIEERRKHVTAANERLANMDAKGQISGIQRREGMKEIFANFAATLAKLP